MKNSIAIKTAVAALLASSPAVAETLDQVAHQPGAGNATAVADVVVTANRYAQSTSRVGSSVSVLAQEDIEREQNAPVVELLSRVAGVTYSRNGGPGGVSSVYIRGAEGHHTVVLIDGVKLNDPSSTQGGYNFGNMLVGDTARIEVLRGAQSTLWGSQAIGGVVNIISARPQDGFEARLAAEAGSRGTSRISTALGGANARFDWRVSAGRYDTDGYSAYAAGTEDDGFTAENISARANLRVSDALSLDVRAHWNTSVADQDGWGADSPDYGKTDELVAYAGLNLDLFDNRLRNRIAFSETDVERNTYSPLRNQPLSYATNGGNRRVEYQGSFAFTDNLQSTFGIETERSRMAGGSLPERPAGSSEPLPRFAGTKADLNSIYGQIQWTMANGLTLTGGLRHDDHSQYGDILLGQASAAWPLNEGRTILRASWGEGFRAPGLYELYSEYGNLTLAPEEVESYEFGVEQRLGQTAVFNLTAFHREAGNEIRYFGCSYGNLDPLCSFNGTTRWGYYKNIQSTRATGIEAAAQWHPLPELSISANYSWTEAVNASGTYKDNQLVRRPEHMANLAADYSWKSGLKTGVAIRYVGTTFDNESNTLKLAAYRLVDVRASYPLTDTVDIYGRIENLFDEQYETVRDYGTAGRGAFVGVRVKY